VDDVRSAAPGKGCTCTRGPAYYVVVSLDGGGIAREAVGHNRKEAERRLRAIEVRVDQDVYEPADNVTFAGWCDAWLSGLRRKETTRRSYRPSLEYAKQAIGQKPTPEVTTSDVRAFLEHIERVHKSRKPSRQISSTTLAKHLRHLGACLQAAKLEGKIAENPVRLLAPSARPKPTRKRPSYFTNDELAHLWPQLLQPAVNSYLCRTVRAARSHRAHRRQHPRIFLALMRHSLLLPANTACNQRTFSRLHTSTRGLRPLMFAALSGLAARRGVDGSSPSEGSVRSSC